MLEGKMKQLIEVVEESVHRLLCLASVYVSSKIS